jgi:Cu(I)/Ag(I) efflux system membrane fusion protein
MTLTGKLILGFGLLGLSIGVWMFAGAGSEDPHAGHNHDSAIDYYTCPMHPSVKLHDPDAPCPICGMDLTAVPKVIADATNQSNRPGFISLSTDQQRMIGLTREAVVEARVSSEIRTIGRVTYDETRLTDVNLKVSGWIQDLYVDSEGKPVKRGEPLFTLYSPELVTSQDEYLLAFQALQRLETEANRAPNEAGNEAIEWNKRLLASARERLRLWDLTPEQIRALESSGKRQTAVTIYAPSSGIVIERMAVTGMHVKPDMRLYRIVQLDSVWIQADVYEQDLASVREGQRATVTLAYLPGRSFDGVVGYVYPYLNPKSRTATVRIQVSNSSRKLKPDMYADVVLHGEEMTQLLVPESAVLFSGERRIVFRSIGEGRFQPTEVSLGRRHSDGYEVLSGVEVGDMVVTSANFLLDSESKLKNVMAGMHAH